MSENNDKSGKVLLDFGLSHGCNWACYIGYKSIIQTDPTQQFKEQFC